MPKTKVLCFGMPTLGSLDVKWFMHFMQTMWPMACTRNFLPIVDAVGGEIAECRNRLVSLFMSLEADGTKEVSHIGFLDDDVLPPPQWVLKLLDHNAPIASGVYFAKLEEVGEPLIFPERNNGTIKFQPDKVLTGCYGWSMGLSIIKREVFAKIARECHPGLDKYGNINYFSAPSHANSTIEDGVLRQGGTEDFPFFELCMKAGFTATVDCTKYAFGFHHDRHTDKCFPTKQWEQYKIGQDVTWPTPEGDVVWKQG